MANISIVSNNVISHRDLNVATRIGSWMVLVVACVAWSATPANAGFVFFDNSISAEELAASHLKLSMSADPLLEWVSVKLGVCGASTRNVPIPSSRSLPALPVELLSSETPFGGKIVPISFGGSSPGAAGSSSGGGTSASAAIVAPFWELPIPMLVSWPQAGQLLDIPPVPPFELLRPPQILTVLS